jgi:DNA invertase Pin-like site-specific DNA recombinase
MQSNQRAVAGPSGASASDQKIEALGYVCVRAPARVGDSGVCRQEHAIAEFCRARGWDLLELLRDVEISPRGESGQPALRNAIERLQTGRASCLVVVDVRQLCSSVAELGCILEAVAHAGGRFVSLEPGFDTGTPIGRSIARSLASVSNWERARRSEMTSAARSKAAVTHAMPASLKRRIVRMRSAGLTLQAIADELNEEGVPTPRGGVRWRPSSVQATLGYKRPGRWTPIADDG